MHTGACIAMACIDHMTILRLDCVGYKTLGWPGSLSERCWCMRDHWDQEALMPGVTKRSA